MMKTQTPILLLLWGAGEYSLKQYDFIVTWCPIRHTELLQKGVESYLFGDFSPGEERGVARDLEYQKKFETCLHHEAESNLSLRWVPLAIQHLKLRVSRYLWLKECVRSIIRELHPHRIVLSSNQDFDIVSAVTSVGKEYGISVAVERGACDPSFTNMYRLAGYVLPRKVDPAWFHALRWRLFSLLRGGRDVFLEPYPNIPSGFVHHRMVLFKFHRAVNILQVIGRRLLTLFGVRRLDSGESVNVDLAFDAGTPRIITKEIWDVFSDDEQYVINGLLARYVARYPPERVDVLADRIVSMLSITHPSRIILTLDNVDANRLVTYVAKQQGVLVEYLPHGIVYEWYSGSNQNLPFQYDRMLAWSEGSRQAFSEFGWPAQTIRHPVNRQRPKVMKRLPQDRTIWKVLLLVSEWGGISQGGREDCAVVETMEIYRVLTDIGVPGRQIDVKFHISSSLQQTEIRHDIFERMKSVCDMRFTILDSSLRSRPLMLNYDLVILGSSSGIFEAVLQGIPLVHYGTGFDSIGTLRECPLPRARSGEELHRVLKEYTSDDVARLYTSLAYELQRGASIIEV